MLVKITKKKVYINMQQQSQRLFHWMDSYDSGCHFLRLTFGRSVQELLERSNELFESLTFIIIAFKVRDASVDRI